MARSVRVDHVQNFRFRVAVRPESDTLGNGEFFNKEFFLERIGLFGEVGAFLRDFVGFSKVSIPSVTLGTEDFKEGTWPFRRRVVTEASLGTLTLEKGVTRFDSSFWRWAMGAVNGKMGRQQLIIQLLHRTREPALPPGRAADRLKSAELVGSLNVAGSQLTALQLKPTILTVAKQWIVHEAIPVGVKPASDLDATSPEVSIMELEVQGNWMEETELGKVLTTAVLAP